MPVRNDILLTATEDLLPDVLQDLFIDGHPAMERIWNDLDTRQSGGEYAAFDVVTDGPGDATQITGGTEAYTYGIRNIVEQGRVYIPEIVYAYAVLGKDLRRNKGPNALVKLVKKYPEKALLHLKQEVARQFITGTANINGLGGVTTVNGDSTFSPDGTALNGVFDFTTQALQADTVFNLPKEGAAAGVTGWYNQYGTVASFATNGKRVMRDVYNQCKIRGGAYGNPDIGLCDSASFNNYYDSLDDQVRYAIKTKGEEGSDAVEGLMFHQLQLWVESVIDDELAGQFAGHSGIMQFFNTATWHMLTLGEDDNEETKGLFSVRTVGQLQGRDAFGHELVLAMQPYCDFLKANGLIEGTATP